MSDLSEFTASALAEAYRSRRLSPVEVARDGLARIDRHQQAFNAFCHVEPGVTLAMASAAEARWREGTPLSALDGVPVTIKDNIDVAGWPSRKGSAVVPTTPAALDAPVTARLRDAGAVILGKTTMPEFGWKGTSDSPLTGITRNPWNPACTTGGSSAGAAAAAILGIGRIHIGTDGAGSVRIPAAFTGLVGIKSTYGRVPAAPISVMGVLAHLGPLTRTVEETVQAMAAIASPDPRDMMATLPPLEWARGLEDGVRGLRIAYSPALGQSVEVDPDVARQVAAAARTFEALGAHVEQVDPGFTDPVEVLLTLWNAGAALALAGITPADRARMDPGLVASAEAGARLDAATYVEALLYKRNALAETMARFHQRFDLLISPTMPLPAFEAGRLTPVHGRYGEVWTNWSPFTYPFNLTQQPAMSVPAGLTSGGMPVGLQIIGAFGDDLTVLRAARAFEAARPFPLLPAGLHNL
ncbi:MAG: amidase [Beijerinckiaceae bacterium]|nr:amidase [Beijerinckiaceae bacterium]MCZ8301455.1 amidase [Beijerinckiaceae bacterium]